MSKYAFLGIGMMVLSSLAQAAPVMMSPEWASSMCEAWNKDAILTGKLAESGWVKNDKSRGHKVMQIYRSDCEGSPRIELRTASKEGKALCVFGGKGDSKLDDDVDYLMWAHTRQWVEMGKGEYGPMSAMFFRRLNFNGPMGEAMGNMGPFESFLLLVGKVPADTTSCPAK